MTLQVFAGERPSADAAEHARVHAGAFASADSGPEAWSEATFHSMRKMDGFNWIEASERGMDMTGAGPLRGFALFRRAGEEADLLTIARDPAVLGAGIGQLLLDAGLRALAEFGIRQVFLEVAKRNAPARKLYGLAGFTEVGERKRYYHTRDGRFEDALILSLYP